MKGDSAFRVLVTVWKWEIIKGVKSKRLVLAIGIFSLLPILAVPKAISFGQAYDPLDVMLFTHVVRNDTAANRSMLVLYTLSAWGEPVGHYPIEVAESTRPSPIHLQTNSEGLLLYPLDVNESYVFVFEFHQYKETLYLAPGDMLPSAGRYDLRPLGQLDLDFDRRPESQLFHAVLATGGRPATDLRVRVNGALQGFVDSHGYFRAILPEGNSEIVVGNETSVLLDLFTGSFAGTGDAALPRRQGPSAVLAALWNSIVPFLVPLPAIAFAIEAISSERVQGTLELLQTRPIPRLALGAGKFAGPLTLIVLGCALAAGLSGLIGYMTYGEFVPARAMVGFLLGQVLLAALFLLITFLLSAVARGMTESYIAAIGAWLVLGPAWSIIGSVFRNLAPYLSPYELATKVVALAMPKPVVFSWGPFFLPDSWENVVGALMAWFSILLVLNFLWWYAPQLRSLMRGRSRPAH